jgi:hypothetical protein
MAKKRVRNRAAGTKKKVSKKARKKTQRKTSRMTQKTSLQETQTVVRRSRSITTAAPGACIDLITAGEIVQAAVPSGPHDIDTTLENAGLITDNQRRVFRADVVDKVSAHGCSIDEDDVPNSAATTLRAARTAVQQNAQ